MIGCGARTGRSAGFDDRWTSSNDPPLPSCTHVLKAWRDPDGLDNLPDVESLPTAGVLIRGQALRVPWVSRSGGAIVTTSVDEAGLTLEVHDYQTGELRQVVSLGITDTTRMEQMDLAELLAMRVWGEPLSDRVREEQEALVAELSMDEGALERYRIQHVRRWDRFALLEPDQERALEEAQALGEAVERLGSWSHREVRHGHVVRSFSSACSGCLCMDGFALERDEVCHVRVDPSLDRAVGLWSSRDAPGLALAAGQLLLGDGEVSTRRWVIHLDEPGADPIELRTPSTAVARYEDTSEVSKARHRPRPLRWVKASTADLR
jgi:hypothetical protein